MSKLLNFTATGTIGPVTGGFRMGNIALAAAGAAGAATIIEVIGTATFTRMQLAAVASSMGFFGACDVNNGIVFDGPLIISAISGAGATILIEEM